MKLELIQIKSSKNQNLVNIIPSPFQKNSKAPQIKYFSTQSTQKASTIQIHEYKKSFYEICKANKKNKYHIKKSNQIKFQQFANIFLKKDPLHSQKYSNKKIKIMQNDQSNVYANKIRHYHFLSAKKIQLQSNNRESHQSKQYKQKKSPEYIKKTYSLKKSTKPLQFLEQQKFRSNFSDQFFQTNQNYRKNKFINLCLQNSSKQLSNTIYSPWQNTEKPFDFSFI